MNWRHVHLQSEMIRSSILLSVVSVFSVVEITTETTEITEKKGEQDHLTHKFDQ
jgi:hypothetical protein